MSKRLLTHDSLVAFLNKRASAKAAAGSSGDDPVTDVQDSAEKGTEMVPKDPDAVPGKQNTPESKTNADGVTPVKAPEETPSETIKGEEKPASDMAARAKNIGARILKVAASFHKQAEDGGNIAANMPAGTDAVSNPGSDGGANKPPSGGAGSKNNPDANAEKNTTKKSESDKAANPMTADGKDVEKKVQMPKGDDKGEIPDSATNSDKKASTKKASEALLDELTDEDIHAHVKLARVLLATEEGRIATQRFMEEAAGAEIAESIIKSAMVAEQELAELDMAEAEGAQFAEQLLKSASEEEREQIFEMAEVHAKNREKFATELEKQAYDMGMQDAAVMDDAGLMGGMPEGEEGMAGMEGQVDQQAIIQALDELVQGGELTPEDAAMILEQALGEGEIAGGAGGEMPMGGGEAPAEESMPPAAGGGESEGGEEEEGEEEEEEEESEPKEASAAEHLKSALDEIDETIFA